MATHRYNLTRAKINLLVLGAIFGLAVVARAQELPDKVSFNFDVRPILSENCFFCHGPDANQRQADLRLDTEDGIADAVEAGDPDASEMVERIFSHDADTQMPPLESGRVLSKRDKSILKKWIEQGARYESRWGF